MAHNYSLRHLSHELPPDWPDSDNARSTIDGSSSPFIPIHPIHDGIPFLSLDSDNLPSDDINDLSFSPKHENPTPKLSDDEKVVEVLQFMKGRFPRLSLRDLLTSIFSSDLGTIKNYTNKYLNQGGRIELMELLVGNDLHRNEELSTWIMEKASQVCQRELSQLTDRASRGPHFPDAEFLRVSPESVTVDMVKSFQLPDLTARYERATPKLQLFLRQVIGKDSLAGDSASQQPDHGRTLITSMLLKLRSRLTTYHPIINALMLWDNWAPKRLIQAFNRYGFSVSYSFLLRDIPLCRIHGLVRSELHW